MRNLKYWLAMTAFGISSLAVVSCGDDDDPNTTTNPAETEVAVKKTSDTAILLCTFGSTFEESVKTYDATIQDFEKAFPNADIYLSFTSYTCVNRVENATGIKRYQPDLWLRAIGEAGYKRVAVQSLHIIPGEEYLNLMNSAVKKDFMIGGYPSVEVAKGACLIYDENDSRAVASVLYDAYKDKLADKKNILLLMGHGNPDVNYNANSKYSETEGYLQDLATNKNVFIGTVDYGPMLFWPESGEPNPECVYSKLMAYCESNNLKPEEITVTLAPFMSVAGDHAHNDLWGIEEGDDYSQATPQSDACWRLKLLNMGFQVDLGESHNDGIDHCAIKGLGDYDTVRQIWIDHLKAVYDDPDAWETGESYQ